MARGGDGGWMILAVIVLLVGLWWLNQQQKKPSGGTAAASDGIDIASILSQAAAGMGDMFKQLVEQFRGLTQTQQSDLAATGSCAGGTCPVIDVGGTSFSSVPAVPFVSAYAQHNTVPTQRINQPYGSLVSPAGPAGNALGRPTWVL